MKDLKRLREEEERIHKQNQAIIFIAIAVGLTVISGLVYLAFNWIK